MRLSRIVAIAAIIISIGTSIPSTAFAEGQPLHGGELVATGVHVGVTINDWNGDAVFTDELWLSSPATTYIATFDNPYTGPAFPIVADLGQFDRGTSLVFKLVVHATTPGYSNDYFTGPGSLNIDRLTHAVVTDLGNDTARVAFEDLMYYYGDGEFREPVFVVTGVKVRARRAVLLKGWMTGGGSLFTDSRRVTHGFELHCDATDSPNNLEVNWDGGNNFHLDTVRQAGCYFDQSVGSPTPVAASFNSAWGVGYGSLNGVRGAFAFWTFSDGGEPGTRDRAWLRIWAPGRSPANSAPLLNVSGAYLTNGNQQAH